MKAIAKIHDCVVVGVPLDPFYHTHHISSNVLLPTPSLLMLCSMKVEVFYFCIFLLKKMSSSAGVALCKLRRVVLAN